MKHFIITAWHESAASQLSGSVGTCVQVSTEDGLLTDAILLWKELQAQVRLASLCTANGTERGSPPSTPSHFPN